MTSREAWWFDNPTYERLAHEEARTRARLERQRQVFVTEQNARRLVELAQFYPNLTSGPLTAAAIAGIDPQDPGMADMALRAAQRDAEALDSLRLERLNMPPDEGFTLFGGAYSLLKGITRTMTLGIEYVWEELVQRNIRTMVGLSQGLSWSEAYARAGPSNARMAFEAWQRGERVNLGSGFFAVSELSPETQRLLGLGVDISIAIHNEEQRQLGTPLTHVARQQRESGIMLTSPGGIRIPVSPGRLLALNLAEPGTTAHNIVSGFTDLAANIFLDPANYALLGISRLRHASRAIVPGGSGRGFRPRDWEAALDAPDGRRLIEVLSSGQMSDEAILGLLRQGQANPPLQLVDRLATAARSRDPALVRETLMNLEASGMMANPGMLLPRHTLTGRLLRGGGSITGKPIAGAIGEFGIPAAVQAGVGAAVGAGVSQVAQGDPLKGALVGAAVGGTLGRTATRIPGGGEVGRFMGQVGGIPLAVKHNIQAADTYLAYLMTRVGARGLNVRDMDAAVIDLAETLHLMRIPAVTRNEILRQAYTLRDGDMTGLYGAVKVSYEAFRRKLIADGVDPQVATELTRLWTKSWPEARAFWVNQARKEQYAPNTLVTVKRGDIEVTTPMATLFSQMMDQWIPLIDPRRLRQMGREMSLLNKVARDAFGTAQRGRLEGVARSDIAAQALTRIGDSFMDQAWKPLVLLRLAWPVRVIGEEQLRMAFSGMPSIVRHPIKYLSMVLAGPQKREGLIPGEPFADMWSHAGAMSRRNPETFTGIRHSQAPRATAFGAADYNDPRFWSEGAVNFVGAHATDPISRAVAAAALDALDNGRPVHGAATFLQEVKDQFWRDRGQRPAWMKQEIESLRHQLMADGTRFSTLSERHLSDAYIDINVWGRMAQLSRGSRRFTLKVGAVMRPDAEDFTGGQRIGVEIAGQRVHVSGEWIDEAGRVIDPQDLIPFFTDSPGIQSALAGGTPIPAVEARRLSGLTRDEFVDIFGRVQGLDNFRPVPIPESWAGLPDGVYRLPGHRITATRRPPLARGADPTPAGQWASVVVIRRGHVVGQLTYEAGEGGAIRQIANFATSPPASGMGTNLDGWQMIRRMLYEERPSGDSLLRLALSEAPDRTPITVERWLRSQGINTEGLNTPEAIIDALREAAGSVRAGGAVTAPSGAELMTPQGARAFHGQLRRAADGRIEPAAYNITEWPQPHPYTILPTPDDVPPREVLEIIASGGMWKGRSLYQDIAREAPGPRGGTAPFRAALRPGRKGARSTRSEFADWLRENLDGPGMRNNYFPVPMEPEGIEAMKLWDEAINRMFDIFMGVPTDRLSRSPAFQQFYWRRVSQLLGHMSEEDAAFAISRMKAQKVTQRSIGEWASDLLRGDDATLAQLSRMAGPGFQYRAGVVPAGRVTWQQADTLAKSFALSEAKDLLYDITRKHNIFDITRHFFPFGEAWLEILTRWAKIIRNNPRVLRRLDQTIAAGRRSGIFYTDPNTGEEVFNYPGSALMSQWMFGDPETMRHKNAVLDQWCREVGRDPAEIERSTSVPGDLRGDTGYGDEQVAEGVTLFTFGIGGPDFDLGFLDRWVKWRDRVNGAGE